MIAVLLAGRIGADVCAAPGALPVGSTTTAPAGVPDDPQELALLAGGPARDAGPGRIPPCGRAGRRAAGYDATSFAASPSASGRRPLREPAAGSWACTSLRMLIRQPVSLAARLAFWPAAPDRQREHLLRHGHVGDPVLLVDDDPVDLGRREGLGDEDGGVLVPLDDVDLLAGQLGHDRLDAGAALADRGADRVEALLARGDRDLAPAARVARDRLDLDGAGVDLGDLQLEQAAQEALVGAADAAPADPWASGAPRGRRP